MINSARRVLSLLLLIATAGCATSWTTGQPDAMDTSPNLAAAVPQPDDSTLYGALGGAAGVESITVDFIREIAADARLKRHFKDTNIARFHEKLQQQLCMVTGGGCTYTGDNMKDTHAGLAISKADFNATVEALIRAMDTNRIAVGTQNRLLAILAPMQRHIVQTRTPYL